MTAERSEKKAKAAQGRNSRHPVIRWLNDVFRVSYAEMFRLNAEYARHNSRPTKRRHLHCHRPAGSKLLKRYARSAWELRYRQKEAAE